MAQYEDLLASVDPKWQPAFQRFVETAQADEDFLQYLSSDPACERAAELAIQREAESLGDLSTLLARSIAREPETVSRSMANVIQTVMDLDADSRGEVLSATARQLDHQLGSVARSRVAEMVTTLANRLTP